MNICIFFIKRVTINLYDVVFIIKNISAAHVLHHQRVKHVYLTSQIYIINEFLIYIIIIKNT